MSTTDVWELIEFRASETPDSLAVVDVDGLRLTFGELREEALRIAAALHSRGVTTGSRVAWQLPTRVETLALMAALSRLGAEQNLLIPMLRSREIGFIVDQWHPQLLIVPDVYRGFDHAKMANSLLAERSETDLLVLEDLVLPRADPSALPPHQRSDEDKTSWVLYTSGTTSDPKGVRHSDATVLRNGRNMVERMQIGPTDRTAFVAPAAHVGGIALFAAGFLSGGANIVADVFNDDTIAALDREGVTLAGMGTTFHQEYLRYRRTHGPHVLTEIRAFSGGGSGRPSELHAELVKEFGAGILSGYGSTETGLLTLPHPDDPDDVRANTEGTAYEGTELRIVMADDKLAGPGEIGEIVARCPQMMLGYVDNALSGVDQDGWFRTGDLGYLGSAGDLRITGRLKDIIIRKGENISAAEVEAVLARHPVVVDVAVVGIPDPRTGERCCAVVVQKNGTNSLDVAAVREFLTSEGLAIQKCPEQVDVVDELPRAGAGKLAKNVLRNWLMQPTVHMSPLGQI